MAYKKRIGRFLLFRLTFLGLGVLFLGVLISLSIQKTKPKEVSAVVGSLNITGSATYTTITSTSLVTGSITSGLINGQTISNAANFTGSLTAAGTLTLSNNTISCTGCVDTTDIANGTIGAADIGTDVITAVELAANSVGDSELFNGGTWNLTSPLIIAGGNVDVDSLTSGLINGQTISSTANFTGSVDVATNIELGTTGSRSLSYYGAESNGYITKMQTTATAGYGTYGPVSGDWALYNKFTGATTRGWIWQFAGANVGALGGTGNLEVAGTVTSGGLMNATNYLQINGKYAIDGTDSYLRLNQQNSFTSGTYSPYVIRSDGGFNVDSYTAIDASNTWHYAVLSGTYDKFGKINASGFGVDANNNGTYDLLVYDGGSLYTKQIYFGYGGAATIATYDVNENLAIMPNGTGNVGIGTTAPGYKLEVNGSFYASTATFGVSASPADVYVCASAAGRIYGYPSCGASDRRLKTNIKDISNHIDVLSALKKLRGVYFNWDLSNPVNKGRGSQRQVGMIAQDVEAVLPELVTTREDGYKSLDYAKYTGFLTEVVKAQQKQIEELQKVVKELKK